MRIQTKIYFLLFFCIAFVNAQNVAPILSATGNQIYCPQSSLPIVTQISITDPDDIGIEAMYIQISSGYVLGEDLLTLIGVHPNIISTWNAIEGKLTLRGIIGEPTYLEFISAIESVVFSNNTPNPSGQRIFSITVGQANYLASTDHYYQFIPNIGITWNNARIAASASTYYGLQGYLATITSMDEVQISGIQASGAGWIGGTDEETEGVWKWATGPENGTIFWNGGINGSTPNFAFWNSGEPNNQGNEDYAHVTAPGVGQLGSWNDLDIDGETSGDYQPKGYIVEYGGMPGDPILQIATTSTITIPQITSVTNASRCDAGEVTLTAFSNIGQVNWYTTATGGIPFFSGNSLSIPMLSTNTIYYVDAYPIGCSTSARTPVTATVNETPITSFTQPNPICENETASLNAQTSSGIVYWYDSPLSTIPIFTGTTFTISNLITTSTFYFEAINVNCISDRKAITILVNPKPVITDEILEFCENTTLEISAGINNVSYLWSTNETSQSITIQTPGNYSVLITNSSGCNVTKNFIITQNPIPQITSIEIQSEGITILTSNSGDFLYSLDGIQYVSTNEFTLSEGGYYTAYVKDSKECGIATKQFVFIVAPKFFTPNNDGINDVWLIKGLDFFPNAKTKIFNRYGKLIYSYSLTKPYWDGTLNSENLPATDYWYVLEIPENNQIIKGHFSLKR